MIQHPPHPALERRQAPPGARTRTGTRVYTLSASWHGAGVYPTVAQVLELEAVRGGRPRVVAGARGLGRQVRWTHVAELPDITHLLKGGELLLSTGVAFPDDPRDLTTFVANLADAGTSGLVVELGRRYSDHLPAALTSAAERLGLPVVELRRETPFVQVTEAVHAVIVDAQLTELRHSDEVHRTFTELSIEGADPEAIVRQTARMAKAPVVLESLGHQVLAFDPAGASAEQLLDRWESRSRRAVTTGRTTFDAEQGWVVATVGARGTDWGRLVIVLDAAASGRDLVLAERAAGALALGRLLEHEQVSLERQTHRSLLTGIVDQTAPSHELHLRAKGLGVPLEGRHLVAVVVRPARRTHAALADQARLRRLADVTADSLRGVRVLGLVGVLDDATVGLLLVASTPSNAERALESMSRRVRRGSTEPVVIAAGSTVADVLEVRRSFLEAAQVADVVGDRADRPFHRLADVGLAGLLHLLRDDERLQTYVERELGPLLAHDVARVGARGGDLLTALRCYLGSGRNKSAAAAACGLSRPAFYDRLKLVEEVLGVDLDDVATCLSLQVATAALDAIRSVG
jgi:PucR family transcriptional regulator, purine catabolism regulatory protein